MSTMAMATVVLAVVAALKLPLGAAELGGVLPRHPPQRLRLLSLNVFTLPWGFSSDGDGDCKNERLDALCRRHLADFDVVGLQELFGGPSRRPHRRRLRPPEPHIFQIKKRPHKKKNLGAQLPQCSLGAPLICGCGRLLRSECALGEQRPAAHPKAPLGAVVVHERVPEVEVRETRQTRSQRVDAVVADIRVRERHRLELR